MTRRTLISAWILAGLLGLVFLAVLIAPAREEGEPYSSYSAGANGVRLGRDLLERLGWKPEARIVPFADSLADPAPVQVLVSAAISESEARDLLSFVRQGGGLVVAGGNGVIQDSLGLVERGEGTFAEDEYAPHCERRGTWQAELARGSLTRSIGSSRPLPPDTVGFGNVVVSGRRTVQVRSERAGIGLPLGRGRVVVLSDPGFFSNDVLRRCELGTDVDFVRMIEYLSRGRRGVRVAFDEFHHGYGVRGGSFTAIRMYLSGTPSGRMLAQIAIGGLLLLFAAAPRPLAPRDPSHVARRSPLEHADALAHAYAGVNATRTATARLLAGVRRRARARSRAKDADAAFLASAASISPAAAAASEVVSHALESPIPSRQLPEVAAALETIERELTRPRSSHRPR
jgi:hypothetical protein